jgi:hypothetical protein
MKNKKRQYTNGATKLMSVPDRYHQGFLKDLDKRSEDYKRLMLTYETVVADLGGAETLSRVHRSLVERFCFMEHAIRLIEQKLITEPDKAGELLGRWTQCINAFLGLAKTIGLERQAGSVVSLQSYIQSQSKKQKRNKVS